MTVVVESSPVIEVIDRVRAGNRESEWVEFKVNNDDPEEIGEYIAALANSATLLGKPCGYLVWGINNITKEVVGTTVDLRDRKVGNEEIESWLARLLSPRVNFRIHVGVAEEQQVCILEVPAASHTPVRFRDHEFIRNGTYKKKLRDFPEKERALWRILERNSFENEVATRHLSAADVLASLDYPAYFELTARPLPETRSSTIELLCEEHLIEHDGRDSFNVTNLGAMLFARDLCRFPPLRRKTVRVIVYSGRDRVRSVREQEFLRGYAAAFEAIVGVVNDLLPQSEEIQRALRTESRTYPKIAIRELIANALIHQDFRVSGTGPMVEVFTDRIEITNPGTPLIDTDRFLDYPPRSRNEQLAALMRRMNMCEERGSGIDKVITSAELHQLPPPSFDVTDQHTKATLFAPRQFARMNRDERVRACYQHASLRYISNERMTNTSLRERFGIEARNYSVASRIIADTLERGFAKREDSGSRSKKHAKYLPFWA